MKIVTLGIAMTIIIGVFVYTLSFAYGQKQNKNYRGAIGVFLLGLAAVVLPIYVLFFR